MASIILEKRDLRNRNRNVAIDKKPKNGKSVAAKKLEVLYQQDIGNERRNEQSDDEEVILETSDVQDPENRELNHFEDVPLDFQTNDPGIESGAIPQPLSKKEKKCAKRYDELKKDFVAVNGRMDHLVKEMKAIKGLIKRWGTQPDSSDEVEDEMFDELPRFPLTKVKHVILMYENISNFSYKKQLVAKLRTIGGASIKKNVINIFKRLFSSKLKTRFCWKGSPEKKPFENFDRIVDVIRQAVKSRHKNCTTEDIERECKLRFKQAEKDFEREQLKLSIGTNDK